MENNDSRKTKSISFYSIFLPKSSRLLEKMTIEDIFLRNHDRTKKGREKFSNVDAIEEFLQRDGGRKLRWPIRNRGKPQKERPRDSEETTRKKERVKKRGRENEREREAFETSSYILSYHDDYSIRDTFFTLQFI